MNTFGLTQIGQEAESKHMDTTNKIEDLDAMITSLTTLKNTLATDADTLNSRLKTSNINSTIWHILMFHFNTGRLFTN